MINENKIRVIVETGSRQDGFKIAKANYSKMKNKLKMI